MPTKRVYDKKVEAESIVFKGAVPVPPSAHKLIATLESEVAEEFSEYPGLHQSL